MPLIKKPMRYAHPEGHTDVCYFTGERRGLITCGSDGDVRSWVNLLDDDPTASCVAEQAIVVISKNDKIYVGNDNNAVQILNYPDLEKEGIVTRFSASVSALATTRNSNIIVCGGCDMRIQVVDISTSNNTELLGHEAPILGLSLDPKEEFVASSSADGSVRVWNIKEKRAVHIWPNVVPKSNSFFAAKTYGVPSFHPTDGSWLAYPNMKDVVLFERSSWKESFRLKCVNIRSEISICKFSECGTLIAASTVQGEIIVWNVETKELIGYLEHAQKTKITGLSWSIDKPDEIAFCDMLGQLGCISVVIADGATTDSVNGETNGDALEIDIAEGNDEDDDDGEDVISLNKIKKSVEADDDDQRSETDVTSEKSKHERNVFAPEINLQPPFQPGSSPLHVLSRFMVWNDTGMVRCFTSEDGEESSIEVEFHDASIHRSMHINNYLRHTIAALSPQALALNCPSSDETSSKLVVIMLQGWGSGNKEWSLDLPEDEEGHCVAAGDNFVALATSRRHLRIFTPGGTQREVISLPGPVVTMNGHKNDLLVAYHSGIGVPGDQCMNLSIIQIRGMNLYSRTVNLPLSPSSELMWLGMTDHGSPVTMDADDVIRVYSKSSSLWKVASDLSQQAKGKADHYFLIGISEEQSLALCILCKGSHYPPTTPRPVVTEIPLTPPLCDCASEKTEKESKLWGLRNDHLEKDELILSLIALACRSNLEYRAIELCEQLATDRVIELAIKYTRKINRVALANKIESIVDAKQEDKENERETNNENDAAERIEDNSELLDNDTQQSTISLFSTKKPEMEIKPLSVTEALSARRSNPFSKGGNSPATKGLAGLDVTPDKPQKSMPSSSRSMAASKSKTKDAPKKETFIGWYAKNKKNLQAEFPELNPAELTKAAMMKFKEKDVSSQDSSTSSQPLESRKRKLSPQQDTEPKRTSNQTLRSFEFNE